MAYKNPKTGRIYLRMDMAPICNLHQYANADSVCKNCPITKVKRNHSMPNIACAEACTLYGDEVAAAFEYDIIKADCTNPETPLTPTTKSVSQKFVIHDAYYYKGSSNCDLTLKDTDGMIQLVSSYGEVMGTASSLTQLAELLTAIANDKMT